MVGGAVNLTRSRNQGEPVAWITHYNEFHPQKALGYRSPLEFIAARESP